MKKILFLSFMILVSCQPESKKQDLRSIMSCSNQLEQKNHKIKWQKLPVVIHIEQSVPLEFRNSMKDAAAIWNKELGLTAIEVSDVIVGSPAISMDNHNVVYWLDVPSVMPTSTQAVTIPTSYSGVITDADIVINGNDFRFSTTGENDKVDMKSLMVHEMGHVLGMAHTDNFYSIMFPYLGDGQVRDHASVNDEISLNCIYRENTANTLASK